MKVTYPLSVKVSLWLLLNLCLLAAFVVARPRSLPAGALVRRRASCSVKTAVPSAF